MKHLRIYEDEDDDDYDYDFAHNLVPFKDYLKYKEGDYVILLENDTENASLNMYFTVGGIYNISEIDEHCNDINDLPYRIEYLQIDKKHDYITSAWVNEDQIRKATDVEIDQNKYNL